MDGHRLVPLPLACGFTPSHPPTRCGRVLFEGFFHASSLMVLSTCHGTCISPVTYLQSTCKPTCHLPANLPAKRLKFGFNAYLHDLVPRTCR